MAEDVVDKMIETYKFPKVASKTKKVPIHGNTASNTRVDQDHLYIYGSELNDFLDLESEDPVYKEKIHPEYPYTTGQIVWAVRYEMARTTEDFLARRIRLLLLDARAALASSPKVSKIMAKELNKPESWIVDQDKSFMELAEKYILN